MCFFIIIMVVFMAQPLLSLSTPLPDYQVNDQCKGCHQNPQVFDLEKRCKDCHRIETGVVGLFDREMPLVSMVSSVSKKIMVDMVFVPAGEFWMGNNGRRSGEGAGDPDETPLHKVVLASYYIDIHEVTNSDYKKFVDDSGYSRPYHWKKGKIPLKKNNHPVVFVNWKDANNYCTWAGKRLPLEAEWEKAARGTDARFYPWGDDFDSFKANTPQRWLFLKIKGDTMPVGSFDEGKSPFGLYDMAGNVWEWTESWYEQYPGNMFPKRSYGNLYKVLKGGSWYNCLTYGCGLSAPSSNRSQISPKIRNSSFGFRCAKDP